MSNYCDQTTLICSNDKDAISKDTDANLWVLGIVLALFAFLVFFCLRKWILGKFCHEHAYQGPFGNNTNSGE